MSILFVINYPILFLKEFTFGDLIVVFSAFCKLCAVNDEKPTFLTLFSAELFLLNDLLL